MQIPSNLISRRELLKLGSATLLGLFLSELAPELPTKAGTPSRGRVLATSLVVRDAPAFSGKKLRSVKRDTLLDLAAEIYGGVEGDYNRHWFQLKDGGYVYSGWVQPFETSMNPVVDPIPSTGLLGEITVPYADSAYGINLSPSPGPRLYYSSTHWITDLVSDKGDGSRWYRAYDAALDSHYYTRPEDMHLLTSAELSPLSSQVPAQEKHIEIFLDRQVLLAYEWDTLVFLARIATGRPGFESPAGIFRTFHKRPSYHMFGGADELSIFDLPGVPWDSYITDTGVALHGTYWHNDFGHPHSHGCINMAPVDARWVFRWTLPAIPLGERLALQPGSGTRVEIYQN